jgi:hypothetical protein
MAAKYKPIGANRKRINGTSKPRLKESSKSNAAPREKVAKRMIFARPARL